MIKPKGKNMIVQTLGNKGAVAYSFSLANKIFTVIAPHLQHKAEKQDKRNEMACELINDMKLQEI